MSDLIEKLRLACDDPMWADHVEMPKKLLRHAVDYLDALKKQVEELTKALNRKVDEKCAAVQACTRAEAEVAALRKERDRLNGCLNLANERTDENFDQAVKNAFSAVKLRRENELLRKALEFYADVSKYPAPLTGGMGDLWADCGRIARAALEAAGRRG